MTQNARGGLCLVGEPEKAIDLLDGLLSRPSHVTVATPQNRSDLGSLRDNPRFIELLKKYGGPA